MNLSCFFKAYEKQDLFVLDLSIKAKEFHTFSKVYFGSLDPDHILYGLLSGSSDNRQVRLRSRRPFVSAARNLLDNLARLGI